MKKIKGWIRWFDQSSGEGMLTDFDGNEWYFNEWSFALTHYEVTGKCKTTGMKKTVKTRYFPGMFLSYKIKRDFMCKRLKYEMPVEFEMFDNQRWAIKIVYKPSLKNEVRDQKIINAIESLDWIEMQRKKFGDQLWIQSAEDRLCKTIFGS